MKARSYILSFLLGCTSFGALSYLDRTMDVSTTEIKIEADAQVPATYFLMQAGKPLQQGSSAKPLIFVVHKEDIFSLVAQAPAGKILTVSTITKLNNKQTGSGSSRGEHISLNISNSHEDWFVY